MRLDKYLAERYGSRTKAAEAINSGLVKINGKSVSASYDYTDEKIEYIEPDECYVSNGGYKLSKALKAFDFSVRGGVYADIGASNGGFTDCLFQNGAEKVYCIDVGESQLDKSLLTKNVVILDNYNARNLTTDIFEERLDGAVIDVSFISLTYILGAVAGVLTEGAHVIALIKPQFECECKNVGKNGIVKSSSTRKKIVVKILDFAVSVGFTPMAITRAPEKAGKNIEYLVLLRRGFTGYFEISKINGYAEI